MLLILDPADDRPIYLQLTTALISAIRNGEVKPGERLPPARALADTLDVNMHTVLRAYQTLRDQDLIELRRGRGAVVRATAKTDATIHSIISDLVSQARHLGISQVEVIERVNKEYA